MLAIFLVSPFFFIYLPGSFGLGYFEIGLISAAGGILSLPLTTLSGLLADRYGRKPLIIFGLTGEAVFALVIAFFGYVHSLIGVVVAFLALLPVSSMSGPPSSAYIADFSTPEERTQGFSLLRVSFNAGVAGGAAAGGLLLEFISFPSLVLITGIVDAVATAALFLVLAPSPKPDTTPSGAKAGNERPSSTTSFRGSLSIIRSDRNFLQICVAFGLTFLLIGQFQFAIPLFAKNGLGISYAFIGFAQAINALVVVFGQLPMSRALRGRRHTEVANWGLILYMVAFVGLGAAGQWETLPLLIFFVATVVSVLGENLVSIPMITLPTNMAPVGEVGSYNGAFQTATLIGQVITGLLGGAVLSLPDPLLEWVILSLPALPAAVLLVRVGRRMQPSMNRM